MKHCCWPMEWLYNEVPTQGLLYFAYQVFILCMEVLERMFICMEGKNYLQNGPCVPIASGEGENEVPKKSLLIRKCWCLGCLLTYNTKANFPISEAVTLQPMY